MNTIKKIEAGVVTILTLVSFCLINANAYTVNLDGSVTFEDGDSYGEIAAAYGMNYENLAFYNGDDPYGTYHAGKTIYLGQSSANEYYYTDYNIAHDYNQPNYWEYTNENYAYVEQPSYPSSNYSDDYYYSDSYSDYNYYDYNSYTNYDSYDYGYYDDYQYIPANNYTPTETYSSYTDDDYTVTNDVSGYASYAINYYGDAAYNVQRACELNSGIIIKAGATYRASDYIGSGSYDMGFVDAPGLMSDGSRPMIPGSGICPVTTYIHMAGKDAGMDVIQANPHNAGDGTTGVSYASKEDQAMYSYGSSDLVMTNNTGSDLMLVCAYENGELKARWQSVE